MASNTMAFSSSSSLLSKSNVVKKRSPLRGKTCIAMAGKPFEVPKKYTKVQPMGGRVLIKIAETERETKGGVLLTEGSQQKPTSGALSSSSYDGNFVCLLLISKKKKKVASIENTKRWHFFFSLFCFFFQVTWKRSATTSTASNRAKPSCTTNSASVRTIWFSTTRNLPCFANSTW